MVCSRVEVGRLISNIPEFESQKDSRRQRRVSAAAVHEHGCGLSRQPNRGRPTPIHAASGPVIGWAEDKETSSSF